MTKLIRSGSCSVGVVLLLCAFALLVGCSPGDTTQLTMHPTSSTPVSEWPRFESPRGTQEIWIAPAAWLTSDEIEEVRVLTAADGSLSVAIKVTPTGVAELRQHRLRAMAMMLGDQLLWWPVLRSGTSIEVVGAMGDPDPLTPGDVQRIVEAIGQDKLSEPGH
jgi:hypothetical protein